MKVLFLPALATINTATAVVSSSLALGTALYELFLVFFPTEPERRTATMQITIDQSEIDSAVEAYVRSQGMPTDGKKITIAYDIKSKKLVASIDLSVVVRRKRGPTKTAAAATPEVTEEESVLEETPPEVLVDEPEGGLFDEEEATQAEDPEPALEPEEEPVLEEDPPEQESLFGN
ncbi:MAG: hypothetical protein DRH06_00265 [Deltaproteobacteria bacterium]|nr:MAG: hypothetical protein DRH06_00265 [Deltaproteobacteria bacterium]